MKTDYPEISSDKLVALLSKLFKVSGDRVYDVAAAVDDRPDISLGFAMSSCSFVDRRIPVSSGVRHMQKPFRDFIAPYIEDSSIGVVIASDKFTSGVESLYALTYGRAEDVRRIASRWWDSSINSSNFINFVMGERPAASAAAVQLKSLL